MDVARGPISRLRDRDKRGAGPIRGQSARAAGLDKEDRHGRMCS